MLAENQIAVRDFRPYISKFPFDPTNGFSLEELRALRVTENPPVDFATFWQNAHARNRAVNPHPEFRPAPFASDSHTIRELHFQTLGEYSIGGWLVEPRDSRKIRRVEILGHGYGGRGGPDLAAANGEAIQLFVCSPGFDLSACPDRVATNAHALHVLTGIHSPETYILLNCAAAFWTASRVLAELFPDLPQVYRGRSFGGGMGALMLPWEPRFAAAELGLPTFGYHTLRLQNPCMGSGESVRLLHGMHPQILRRTLTYYDAAYSARYLKIPVLAGVCAFDPSVCPPGQFAVANSIPEGLCHRSEFSFGHCDFPHPDRIFEEKRYETRYAALVAHL